MTVEEKEAIISAIFEKYRKLSLAMGEPEQRNVLDAGPDRFTELTKKFREEIAEVEKEYGKG